MIYQLNITMGKIMKKLLIAAALLSAFSFANANLTNAGINGERVRVGDSYGQIVGKLGQPASTYDYTKNVNGKETPVREVSYSSDGKTYTITIENGKVTAIKSR
jgi:hypothetical protein